MQIVQPSDNHHLSNNNMKVKLEIPAKQAMAPSRSLPRCASELGDPPSPFSSNPAHHPVSMPTTPASATSAASSFGCMAGRPSATDSPPATPGRGGKAHNHKPMTPGAAAVAAYYASQWSPRRLMQRAARAFRTSRSRRTGVVRASSPTKSKVSDRASSPTSKLGSDAANGGGAVELAVNNGPGEEEQRHDDHPDVVPEKIIHEMKRHTPPPPPVVVMEDDECGKKTMPAEENSKETVPAAADDEEEVVESPKKGEALMTPATTLPEPDVVAGDEEVADKFVTVVKEAIKKQEGENKNGKEKTAAATKFQWKVKTAMEARSESEQPPRRRETPRSNDVIEEARSMLLEKRQCSRVRALVGAFETVMDTNKEEAAAAVTPHHRSRRSA